MDAVGLNGAGDIDQVFVDHGHDGGVMAGGEVEEDLIELMDVIGAVVGRQRDAGDEDLDMRAAERGDDGIKIAAGLIEGQAAQAVVAAELDDDDGRVQVEDGCERDDGVFGRSAAGAAVEDGVGVAEAVKIALQGCWICLLAA